MDIAAEPDDIAKAQVIKKREQLVVAETPVGEDRDGTTGRHEFLQPPQAGILEVVPLLRKLFFPDCQPQQWRGPAMRNPVGEAVPHVDILVAEKTVNLFDRMLGHQTARLRQRLPNHRNRQ